MEKHVFPISPCLGYPVIPSPCPVLSSDSRSRSSLYLWNGGCELARRLSSLHEAGVLEKWVVWVQVWTYARDLPGWWLERWGWRDGVGRGWRTGRAAVGWVWGAGWNENGIRARKLIGSIQCHRGARDARFVFREGGFNVSFDRSIRRIAITNSVRVPQFGYKLIDYRVLGRFLFECLPRVDILFSLKDNNGNSVIVRFFVYVDADRCKWTRDVQVCWSLVKFFTLSGRRRNKVVDEIIARIDGSSAREYDRNSKTAGNRDVDRSFEWLSNVSKWPSDNRWQQIVARVPGVLWPGLEFTLREFLQDDVVKSVQTAVQRSEYK